jgi:hypothetical protein
MPNRRGSPQVSDQGAGGGLANDEVIFYGDVINLFEGGNCFC